MNRLILMRHAKTEAWHEGVDDHGRALVARGHTDARLMAETLNGRGWRPDAARISTARRARETWAAMAPVWPLVRPELADELYLAAPGTIESVLGSAQWQGTLIVIGHNPGLHEFACMAARRGGSVDDLVQGHLFEKFPTGCAALFEGEAGGRFHLAGYRLIDCLRPRDIGGGAD